MKIYDFYENFANVLKSQPKIRSNVSKKEMNLKVNQNFLLMLHEGRKIYIWTTEKVVHRCSSK